MDVYDRAVNNEVTFSNVKRILGKKYKNLKDGNLLMIKYADALWQWREVKSQTDSVDQDPRFFFFRSQFLIFRRLFILY